MPKYEVNKFYWLQDRKTGDYLIGHCYDEKGMFSLQEKGWDVDTEEVKPIGPAGKPLSHYIGEAEAADWVASKLRGSNADNSTAGA